MFPVHEDDNDGECSACETEFFESLESNGPIMIASVDSAAMFLSQEASLGRPSTVAVPIPLGLTQTFVETARSNTQYGKCKSIRRIEGQNFSRLFILQIHQYLTERGFRIKGVISNASNPCADLLLLDVSGCGEHYVDEILEILNGVGMSSNSEAVIKPLPISSILVANRIPTSSVGETKEDQHRHDVPMCAVCIHRIDPPRLGFPKPRNDQICSSYCQPAGNGRSSGKCQNENFLRPWEAPSNCRACHVILDHWTKMHGGRHDEMKDVFCSRCALPETLWVCLSCGYVGCGRYSQAHAELHNQETMHRYCLELATLRIWDYANEAFAHRRDLLECTALSRFQSPWADASLSQAGMDWKKGKSKGVATNNDHAAAPPKKASQIGEEYEVLLQSALEDQALHYEGEISRLHAELTAEQVDGNAMTKADTLLVEELNAEVRQLRSDLEQFGRKLLDIQGQEAGHRAASQRLLREQAVAKNLLDKIREEAEKEHQEGKKEVEDLEQQVADLTANLRMRQQISQDQELNNAQIVGAVSPNKPNATKRGKKGRRSLRK